MQNYDPRKFKEKWSNQKVNYDLENKIGLKEEEFKLAGVLILFNNLLQSLFKSQILTLGLVIIGIFAMLLFYLKT